jgi:molybdenum cofactor cytidylyltransferase
MSGARRIAAVILAAGRGARFGAEENKLLAPLNGELILRRVVRTALASRASGVVVVTGHRRQEIEAALAGLDVICVHNPDFASGLASSLRTGLAAAAGEDGALIMLGDMPGVEPAILDALIAAFEKAPGCPAVVPAYRGARGNPVLLSRAIVPRLGALRGDEGARGLLRSMEGVIELPLDDARILADVDTPADLARFKRIRCSNP